MFYLGCATAAYFTYNRKNKGNQLPIFLENHPPYTQNYILERSTWRLFNYQQMGKYQNNFVPMSCSYTCFIKFWVENLTYIFLNMLWNTMCKIYLYILIYNIYEKIRLKIVYCCIVLFLNMLWNTICRIYLYILICNIYENIRLKIVYCSSLKTESLDNAILAFWLA